MSRASEVQIPAGTCLRLAVLLDAGIVRLEVATDRRLWDTQPQIDTQAIDAVSTSAILLTISIYSAANHNLRTEKFVIIWFRKYWGSQQVD